MTARGNRRLALALCAGATLAAAPLHAQDSASARSSAPVVDSLVTREDILEARIDVTMEALELTETQHRKLLPIYTQYREAATKQNMKYLKVLDAFVQSDGAVSNDQALALAANFLQFQTDRVSLQRKYLPKFEAVIPGAKALRLLQLEHKFDAIVNYGLADIVPLARAPR